METGRTAVELRHLLLDSQAVSPDLIASWEQCGLSKLVPQKIVLDTAEQLCTAVANTSLDSLGASGLDVCTLSRLCKHLNAIDAVLAHAEPTIANSSITYLFAQLEAASNALAAHVSVQLLQPLRPTGGHAENLALLVQALQLPAFILVRGVGTSAFTARELLGLANHDMATAVAIAVNVMKAPNTPLLPQLQVRLWQIICDLSTPQYAAELIGQMDGGKDIQLNDTPIEHLLAQHVAHAHRLALCLVQFGALEVVCDCAEDSKFRVPILTACLRTIHNIIASPHLLGPGRLLARRLAVLWPRFGMRLLAQHLRRLLNGTNSGPKVAAQSARELRRDLRTLGWLLHHAPELRPQAHPLCAELAMKVARMNLPAEVLAVVVGTAANTGALADKGTPLYATLDNVDGKRKSAVCKIFPSETNRLWVIEDAWHIVENLGYWPKEPEPELVPRDDDLTKRTLDFAAISKLQSKNKESFAFNFLDPGFDPWDPGQDSCDEDGYWDDFDWSDDTANTSDTDNLYLGHNIDAQGPLGLLNVAPPPAPPMSSVPSGNAMNALMPPMALLCEAPEVYRCAIDGRLCSDPVRTPHGILYERSSIAAWLAWNKVCPITGTSLRPADLNEAIDVSDGIASWVSLVGMPMCRGVK